METDAQLKAYGFIRAAEGELQEAFWKLAAGELGTAMQCLVEAIKRIEGAQKYIVK